MIKHVIAVTLFFPYYYSQRTNPYYQDFILANFFAILAMVFILTSWKLDFKRNGIFVTGMGILLVAYNVCATYMNVKYHHWYGEQINTTIAFLFFIVLLLVKDNHALIDSSTIKATIHMIVASNVIAIFVKIFLNCVRLRFMNNWVDSTFNSDAPYSFWIYNHKSEYGFILVLCITFFALNKKYFHNTITYILSQGILLYALYLSNVYTSMIAALFIFAGQFLDYLFTATWWKKLIAAITIPVILYQIAVKLLSQIETNRDLLTMGYRIPIWKQFFIYAQENPNGILMDNYGVEKLKVDGANFLTNNAHNIFLNHMVRYSMLVGGIYIALFALIILFSLKRRPRFTTLFTWIAVLIPLNMDYSMLSHEFTYFLSVVFVLFFGNMESKKSINKY